MADVMTQEQANAVFDQIDNANVSLGENVEFGDEFAPGRVNVVYPEKLPGRKVRIWDTRTGYSSDILPYMLRAVMKMTWANGGGLMYSRTQTVEPPVGTSWCFLHPNFPDRERVVAAGVANVHCSKPGALLSIMHATRHAETRHGDSYKIYLGYIEDQRKREQDEFQRMQMDLMRRQLGQPVSESAGIFRCDAAGCTRFFDSDQGLKIHKSKEQH